MFFNCHQTPTCKRNMKHLKSKKQAMGTKWQGTILIKPEEKKIVRAVKNPKAVTICEHWSVGTKINLMQHKLGFRKYENANRTHDEFRKIRVSDSAELDTVWRTDSYGKLSLALSLFDTHTFRLSPSNTHTHTGYIILQLSGQERYRSVTTRFLTWHSKRIHGRFPYLTL